MNHLIIIISKLTYREFQIASILHSFDGIDKSISNNYSLEIKTV